MLNTLEDLGKRQKRFDIMYQMQQGVFTYDQLVAAIKAANAEPNNWASVRYMIEGSLAAKSIRRTDRQDVEEYVPVPGWGGLLSKSN